MKYKIVSVLFALLIAGGFFLHIFCRISLYLMRSAEALCSFLR